jgi:Bacterial capsule synthesis protein PGA_cap.
VKLARKGYEIYTIYNYDDFMSLTIALSGDSIINRRISACNDEGFLSLIDEIRAADIGFTHLEMILLDEVDDHAYPAAEAGGTWMSAQLRIAEEFAWAGFEMVSHASNHALDYRSSRRKPTALAVG